jgi:hypothetical protein
MDQNGFLDIGYPDIVGQVDAGFPVIGCLPIGKEWNHQAQVLNGFQATGRLENGFLVIGQVHHL